MHLYIIYARCTGLACTYVYPNTTVAPWWVLAGTYISTVQRRGPDSLQKRQHTAHTSVYVGIRRHTSAYVHLSIPMLRNIVLRHLWCTCAHTHLTTVATGWAEGTRSLTPVRAPSQASVHHPPPWFEFMILYFKITDKARAEGGGRKVSVLRKTKS